MWKPRPPSPYRLCQNLRSPQQHQHQQRCYLQTLLPNLSQHSAANPKPTTSVSPRKSFDDLLPTDLAAYWDTQPANPTQLKSASRFFAHTRHSPVKLYSAAQFRTIPYDSKEPEVAFLGKTNVGKSSLINALVDHEICRSGDKRGKTTEMNAYGIGGTKGGESKIVLLDMPGYGTGSKLEQGEEIMKYLQRRKQYTSPSPCHFDGEVAKKRRLRRTFVLLDLHHGIKPGDQQILTLLRQYAIPHQLVVSKVDRLLCDRVQDLKQWHTNRTVRNAKLANLQSDLDALRAMDQIPADANDARYELAERLKATKGPPPLGEIICVSAMKDVARNVKKSHLNIDALRWSIMQATGFDGSLQGSTPMTQNKPV